MEEGRVCRVLLLGPPGCGKTTVLRDAAKRLAGDGIRVSGLRRTGRTIPGRCGTQAGLDVMRGIDKPTAIQMLLRAMSPQAIFCDEIGDMRDVRALLDAARCGVGLAASAHAGVFDDVLHRPVLRALYEAGAFERYLLLGRHGKLAAAYDAEGKPISGGGIEHEKRRGDGHDFAQRDRLCSGGRRNAPRPLGAGHAPNLMRINDMIRYERVPLAKLLQSIELHATREQRDLTRLLHACGARLENSVNPQLVEIFAAETERAPGYGVLSQTDRSAFEQVMAELGRTGLDEQLRILSDADERLRQREECLRRDAGRRAQLIRTLGVTGGAALFLLLI
ncbi:MAG: AAA family ATPase [Christensenellales bacterium]